MNANQTKFKKIGNRYFLPFDWVEWLGVFVLLFSFIFLVYLVCIGNLYFLPLMIIWAISLYLYVKDRFLTGIKTNLSCDDNVNLIQELAKKQLNVSESLDVKGLFLFEYPIRPNFRKISESEVIVIYCEENTIWVGAYTSVFRKIDFLRQNNLKQWIKLIQLKTTHN